MDQDINESEYTWVGIVTEDGCNNILPYKAHASDAAYDLSANIPEGNVLTIAPHGGVAVIPNGFRCNIPEGFVLKVCSRSGLALKKKVFVLNAPGIVDSGFTGEIGTILCNLGDEPFEVRRGDRVSQLLIERLPLAGFEHVDAVDKTERGDSGFGSTGVDHN